MSKRIEVRIMRDGKIHAKVLGFTGHKCVDYMPLLEELLDAEIIESEYTAEYFQHETQEQEGSEHTNVRSHLRGAK